jgi:hypothetical protein
MSRPEIPVRPFEEKTMSKIDKNIQTAREWLKKHEAEPLDLGALKQALESWQTKLKQVETARVELAAAKEAAILARKEVTLALATAKVARKSAQKSAEPPAPALETPKTKGSPKK